MINIVLEFSVNNNDKGSLNKTSNKEKPMLDNNCKIKIDDK